MSPADVSYSQVGVACAVSGVLVLALPIPIVVENFAAFYDDQKFQQLLQEKKDAHYADILHQFAAQEVALAGLLNTVQTNTNVAQDEEEDDDDATNERSSLLTPSDSGYQ